MIDKEVQQLLIQEARRQNNTLNLIASENYVSNAVREALGSVFVNKYAEGYPRARYYGGNVYVDEIEELAKRRARELFSLSSRTWDVNVQPYSGSPANLAVLHALVPVGEKIMGMSLSMGGHLTHGHKVSVTGKLWRQVSYGVDRWTERINYDEVMRIAKKEQPKLIIAGATAYSRIINFRRMKAIARAVGAYLFVDMSHFAGLVAGRVYPSPFPYADVVTTTTHKTLRGPRAAIIFSRTALSKLIDKAVFPGLQGGPHENQIAAIAVALREAMKPSFKTYAAQVVKNTRTLAGEMKYFGWRVISGGTDTHLFLLDTASGSILQASGSGMSGKEASDALERVGIIVNKNTIPFDERPPVDPSGIRIGAAALTTRGMKEKEMKEVAFLIHSVLKRTTKREERMIRERVTRLCKAFPLYASHTGNSLFRKL